MRNRNQILKVEPAVSKKIRKQMRKRNQILKVEPAVSKKIKKQGYDHIMESTGPLYKSTLDLLDTADNYYNTTALKGSAVESLLSLVTSVTSTLLDQGAKAIKS